MPKELMVAALTGNIYDVVTKNGKATNNKVDRTKECIRAVSEHMKNKADSNEEDKGFWQYEWEGIGTLTWEGAVDERKADKSRI